MSSSKRTQSYERALAPPILATTPAAQCNLEPRQQQLHQKSPFPANTIQVHVHV